MADATRNISREVDT